MTTNRPDPSLIQGGMGVAVSSWRLAQAVARRGQLGVVSGTAIERVFAARLQEGDPGGHLRDAAAAFPDQALVERMLERYLRSDDPVPAGRYAPVPMFAVPMPPDLVELTVLAAFCEVWLARRGHDGVVGINLLEKIQAPVLPTLYGAMLAGVDYVLMGAGIPRRVPAQLDLLARHEATEQVLQLTGGDEEAIVFDPACIAHNAEPLRRPRFLAVVSSHVLATSLARSGGVDGFVVEGPSAGGHNAPPRGWTAGSGAAVRYGPRDVADLERIAALGKPFWLAGGQGRPDALAAAKTVGATGIQVGTLFAFCRESGMVAHVRRSVLDELRDRGVTVNTDGRASPTGYPIKIVAAAGTEGARPADRRVRQTCRLGYLRTAYRRANGRVGWRCPAEPEADFAAKGGDVADCAGRRCICNGLMATAGHPHRMADGELEQPLLTAGQLQDLEPLAQGGDYDVDAVLAYLAV